MADEVYDVGDTVVLTHTVTVDNVAVDPTTVVVDIMTPAGVITRYEYAGGAGVVTRGGVGEYTYRVDPIEGGTWRFKWWVDGNAKEAEEGTFRVKRSRFP